MRDVNIDDEPAQRGPDAPDPRENLVSDTIAPRAKVRLNWKKPFQILKPPLNGFLFAGVNTEQLLYVSVFLYIHMLSGAAPEWRNREALTASEPDAGQFEGTSWQFG